jgi:membrane fusion protein (multidrug efflux system)
MKIRDRYRKIPLMRRRMVGVALITILAFIVIIATPIVAFLTNMPDMTQISTVSTTTAQVEEWHPSIEAVGTLTPSQGADLTVEIPGVVDRVYFESGSTVRAGATLLRLRDADETSRLAALQAAADLAAASDARSNKLFDIQGISKADLEASAANVKSARAAVMQQQAIVAKKAVTAPFAGRLGIRNVNVGQYVTAGTAVVTLQALDPIHLDFSLPQQALARVKVGQTMAVSVDAYPGIKFEGRIAAIDPKVDEATRNFAVRAVMPNKEQKLLPGMYASAAISEGITERHLTLPQAAPSMW